MYNFLKHHLLQNKPIQTLNLRHFKIFFFFWGGGGGCSSSLAENYRVLSILAKNFTERERERERINLSKVTNSIITKQYTTIWLKSTNWNFTFHRVHYAKVDKINMFHNCKYADIVPSEFF